MEKRFPDIKDTIKRGKEVVDRQVENALFKSAVGYEYTEITKELTDSGMKVTKRVTKQVAPNPTSAIFWLKIESQMYGGIRKKLNCLVKCLLITLLLVCLRKN